MGTLLTGRRFAKSGGFRKKATCHHWLALQGLLQAARDIVNTADAVPEKALVSSAFTVGNDTACNSCTEVDANGYPTLFAKLLRGWWLENMYKQPKVVKICKKISHI